MSDLLPKIKAALMEMKIDLSERGAGEGSMAFSQSFETVRTKLRSTLFILGYQNI